MRNLFTSIVGLILICYFPGVIDYSYSTYHRIDWPSQYLTKLATPSDTQTFRRSNKSHLVCDVEKRASRTLLLSSQKKKKRKREKKEKIYSLLPFDAVNFF
jgi:hypothetical protein